jgi:regulator of cell morphogenesis and NO signaling
MTVQINQIPDLRRMAVGQIVAANPDTARVFEKHRIDYCCGGNKGLTQACAENQIALSQVLEELAAIGVASDSGDAWTKRPLSELCDNIERQHHDYLKQELPRLSGLIAKVVNAHGASHPELAEVAHHFQMLRNELEPHMMKEEQVLFPAIRRMEKAQSPQQFPFGSIDDPIHCMVAEHDDAGEELAILRKLNNDYQPHAEACTTWRVMLDSLAKLELDMHQHVHKENSILFPRAQKLEQELTRTVVPPVVGDCI